MKVSYTSDLHLEFTFTQLFNKNNSDVLVLAGDIFPYKYFNDEFNLFLENISNEWKDVIIVLGNHDSYKGTVQKTLEKYKTITSEFPNITILDKSYIDIGDVRFLGGTLWTDFYKNNPLNKEYARMRMNDFRVIKYAPTFRKLLPDDTVKFHYSYLDYFKQNLNHDKVVLITHHAPSLKSIPERYKEDPLSAAYGSELDYLFYYNPNIKVAIHGHIHDKLNYMISETNILTNPRGYPGEVCFKEFELLDFEV